MLRVPRGLQAAPAGAGGLRQGPGRRPDARDRLSAGPQPQRLGIRQGIVSGVGRSIDAANNFKIDKVIQTDAAINPGNSGGPLLDSAGRVIGVNTAILTAGSGGSVGIGFAVPSNTIREVVPRLERGRTVQRAYLGVQTQREPDAASAPTSRRVTPGTPAARDGLQVGDTIVSVGGDPVTIPEDISIAIENRKPGDRVEVEVQRAGSRRKIGVTLGTRPDNAPSTGPSSGATPGPSTP